MTAEQAYELETLQRITKSSDGEMLRLARECAQDTQIESFGHLHRIDAEDMLRTLREYRYYTEIAAMGRRLNG
jgi:hypothetical protein